MSTGRRRLRGSTSCVPAAPAAAATSTCTCSSRRARRCAARMSSPTSSAGPAPGYCDLVAAPSTAPTRLVEMSADVRSAVLLDPAGGLVAASGSDEERGRGLGEPANDLVLAADHA